MQKLLKKVKHERQNITSIMSTSVVGTLTSFAMVLAFANLVDTKTLGTYQYIISIVSIIGSFSMTGILTGIIRAVSKKEYFFLISAKKYLYIGSIPALLLGTCISLYYYISGNHLLAISIFVSNLFYLGMQILYRFNAIYVALNDIRSANILLKLYAVGPIISVLPALFLIKDAHLLAVIYFISTYLAFLIGTKMLKMGEKERELINLVPFFLQESYAHLKFSFHQSVITILNTASAHLDKIIIFQSLGAQQTATYFIAISIPNRFRNIIKQFESFVFSRFARHSLNILQDKMIIRFLLSLLIISPIYLLYISLVPFAFKIFLPQYVNAIFLTQIYAITLFAGAIIIPQSILKAHGESQIFYMLNISFNIVRVVFVYFGILFFGISGAIYGTILTSASYIIANLFAAAFIKQNIRSSTII